MDTIVSYLSVFAIGAIMGASIVVILWWRDRQSYLPRIDNRPIEPPEPEEPRRPPSLWHR